MSVVGGLVGGAEADFFAGAVGDGDGDRERLVCPLT